MPLQLRNEMWSKVTLRKRMPGRILIVILHICELETADKKGSGIARPYNLFSCDGLVRKGKPVTHFLTEYFGGSYQL